jgi:hypothetical protein
MNDDSDTWWSVFQRVLAEPDAEPDAHEAHDGRCDQCNARLGRLMDRAELAADQAVPLEAAARRAHVAHQRAAADARAAKRAAKDARRRWARSPAAAEWRARQKARK